MDENSKRCPHSGITYFTPYFDKRDTIERLSYQDIRKHVIRTRDCHWFTSESLHWSRRFCRQPRSILLLCRCHVAKWCWWYNGTAWSAGVCLRSTASCPLRAYHRLWTIQPTRPTAVRLRRARLTPVPRRAMPVRLVRRRIMLIKWRVRSCQPAMKEARYISCTYSWSLWESLISSERYEEHLVARWQ